VWGAPKSSSPRRGVAPRAGRNTRAEEKLPGVRSSRTVHPFLTATGNARRRAF
jgi:hypothetical protein